MRGAEPFAAIERAVATSFAFSPGESVVAAVSGGPDSVALASLLSPVVAAAGATLVLVHINHGVRPSAMVDEAVTLAVGARLGVRVIARSLPIGSSDEARLRHERYAALTAIAAELGARSVVTAHHARDQTETVLLALFRGTGLDGLGGIAPERRLAGGIRLVRPLLAVDPETLREICDVRNLPYVLDRSNADPAYRRNALRALLVQARAHFPRLDLAVARCARIARDERERREVATARTRLRHDLQAVLGDRRDLPFERLDAIARAVTAGRPGRYFLRRGVEIIITSAAEPGGELEVLDEAAPRELGNTDHTIERLRTSQSRRE